MPFVESPSNRERGVRAESSHFDKLRVNDGTCATAISKSSTQTWCGCEVFLSRPDPPWMIIGKRDTDRVNSDPARHGVNPVM